MGGRQARFAAEQETAIVNMVFENNALCLKGIKDEVMHDNFVFKNITTVSSATID